jgi:ABC-type lipoprotein release transport system permease subunit
LALVRLIENQVYGVAPFDPFTFVVGVLAMVTLAMGAVWWPARRASRIDPMEALRCE